MTTLPSGTVTFLFTDIELSTQTMEAMGNDAYADALDTHRLLLRDAFKAHGGHEVGTEGDSFFVAFARAGNALAAAVDGQRALDGHPLRVRMGMHTGEALLRAEEYVGHDVHKAKRISDAGHGGQILLSQTTADLVGASTQLIDLGPHRLKDLGEPQRLYQAGSGTFPALRSLETFTHNLPPQRTTFIGRETEIAGIRSLLEQNKLVTLTGVGGCGKTRLAVQVGAELLDDYADGVFFVDLAQIADPDVVSGTVATALGVPVQTEIGAGSSATAEASLHPFLGPRTCLIVLDNCEHLLDACAELTDTILGRCPGVTILATSREALDVEGEQSWRVPSLSIPEDGDVQSSEAVSLFKTRARAARADFELTPQNMAAVAEICRRLDGIPLAIEFAAARVAHMSPQEIADRLGDMFKLLAGGRRRRVQRQHTLQAALDWSYELLTDTERLLLRRLAVFPGLYSAEAAEGICAADGIEEHDVFELLGSLVAKSLVTTEESHGRTRYRLIETVRLYASEKLRESGEAEVLRSRHRDWFLAWLESSSWSDLHSGPAGVSPLAPALLEEQANLRSGLEWSDEEERSDLVIRMAARLQTLWLYGGALEEGFRRLSVAQPEDLDIPRDVRVAALAYTANFSLFTARPGGLEYADRAVAAAEGHRSFPLLLALTARANFLAVVSEFMRDPDLAARARRDLDEADEIEVALGLRGHVVGARVNVELILGDIAAAAAAAADQALVTTGRDSGRHANLAAVLHILGDDEGAAEAAERFLAYGRRQQERGVLRSTTAEYYGDAGTPAALALAGTGRLDEAREVFVLGLERTRRGGRPGALEVVVVGIAGFALMRGNPADAARLLAWVRSRTIDAGKIISGPAPYALFRHHVRLARAALDRDEAQRLRAEGAALSDDDACALALEVLHA